jgi:hypothetical protein
MPVLLAAARFCFGSGGRNDYPGRVVREHDQCGRVTLCRIASIEA